MDLSRSSLILHQPLGSSDRRLRLIGMAEGLERSRLLIVERRGGGFDAFRAGQRAGQRVFGGRSDQPGFMSGLLGGQHGGTLGHAAGQWLGRKLGFAGATHAANVTKLQRQIELAKLQRQAKRLGITPEQPDRPSSAPNQATPQVRVNPRARAAAERSNQQWVKRRQNDQPVKLPVAGEPAPREIGPEDRFRILKARAGGARERATLKDTGIADRAPEITPEKMQAAKAAVRGGRVEKHADFAQLPHDQRKAIHKTAMGVHQQLQGRGDEGAVKKAIQDEVFKKHGLSLGAEPLHAVHQGVKQHLANKALGASGPSPDRRKELKRGFKDAEAAFGGQAEKPTDAGYTPASSGFADKFKELKDKPHADALKRAIDVAAKPKPAKKHELVPGAGREAGQAELPGGKVVQHPGAKKFQKRLSKARAAFAKKPPEPAPAPASGGEPDALQKSIDVATKPKAPKKHELVPGAGREPGKMQLPGGKEVEHPGGEKLQKKLSKARGKFFKKKSPPPGGQAAPEAAKPEAKPAAEAPKAGGEASGKGGGDDKHHATSHVTSMAADQPTPAGMSSVKRADGTKDVYDPKKEKSGGPRGPAAKEGGASSNKPAAPKPSEGVSAGQAPVDW